VTRDSAEFSAALLLGALGGAAVALALRSSDLNPLRRRSRERSLSSLGAAFVSSLQEQVKEAASSIPASVGAVSSSLPGRRPSPSDRLDRIRQAARDLGRLRAPGAGFGR
jgi:hypothetical protein